MDINYSVSALNANNIMLSTGVSGLSLATINKLKSLGINPVTVTSEIQAKKLIEKIERPKQAEDTNAVSSKEERLEKLFKRLKSLALKLGITVSENEKIETILNKIRVKIEQIEQSNKSSDLNVIRSEFEMISQQYKNIVLGESSLLTGMDLLGKTNRAALGI